MNLSGLPSDSLYKFCAIAGTVIFMFSIYYPLAKSSEVNSKINLSKKESELIRIENRFNDVESKSIDRELKIAKENSELLEKKMRNLRSMKDVKDFKLQMQEMDLLQEKNTHRIKEFGDTIKRNGQKVAEFTYAVDETSRLIQEQIVMMVASLFTMALGATLAVFGYYNWYNKIQKHLDITLANSNQKPTVIRKRCITSNK